MLQPFERKCHSFSLFFSPVSVHINLLNCFSAVAVTLCPVARCLWAGVGDVERISYQCFTHLSEREGETEGCWREGKRKEGNKGGWGERERERENGREIEKDGEKGKVEEGIICFTNPQLSSFHSADTRGDLYTRSTLTLTGTSIPAYSCPSRVLLVLFENGVIVWDSMHLLSSQWLHMSLISARQGLPSQTSSKKTPKSVL